MATLLATAQCLLSCRHCILQSQRSRQLAQAFLLIVHCDYPMQGHCGYYPFSAAGQLETIGRFIDPEIFNSVDSMASIIFRSPSFPVEIQRFLSIDPATSGFVLHEDNIKTRTSQDLLQIDHEVSTTAFKLNYVCRWFSYHSITQANYWAHFEA